MSKLHELTAKETIQKIVNNENKISLEWDGKLSELQAKLELAQCENGNTESILDEIKKYR